MRAKFANIVTRRYFATILKPVNITHADGKLSEYSTDLLVKYRKQLRRKSFSPGGIYILHEHFADKVVKFLCPQPENETGMVFEANPGPGVLTRRLLHAGVPRIRVFEAQQAFLPELRKLNEEYPRLEIFEDNLFDLSKITHGDEMSEGSSRTEAFLAGIKTNAWKEPPPLKIFGIAPPRQETTFLRFMIAKLAYLSSVFAYGRTQLLLFVSTKEHRCMTAAVHSGYATYRQASVFYNIFFDLEMLGVFPRQLFYPPPHARQIDGHLHLVRLTPKINLMEKIVTRQRLQELRFFVQQNMTKRSAHVIETLEKWIPGCGPRLIANGISIFTRFGDLEPQDILQLFLQFVSWPEYATSNFRHAVSNAALEFSDYIGHSDEDD